MPPRAPVVWTTTAVRSERFRQRIDERHRELAVHADDLSRDYFELWQLIARRGSENSDLDARGAERLDYFATQLGRLEGTGRALILPGRHVRLFPLPAMPWMVVS